MSSESFGKRKKRGRIIALASFRFNANQPYAIASDRIGDGRHLVFVALALTLVAIIVVVTAEFAPLPIAPALVIVTIPLAPAIVAIVVMMPAEAAPLVLAPVIVVVEIPLAPAIVTIVVMMLAVVPPLVVAPTAMVAVVMIAIGVAIVIVVVAIRIVVAIGIVVIHVALAIRIILRIVIVIAVPPPLVFHAFATPVGHVGESGRNKHPQSKQGAADPRHSRSLHECTSLFSCSRHGGNSGREISNPVRYAAGRKAHFADL